MHDTYIYGWINVLLIPTFRVNYLVKGACRQNIDLSINGMLKVGQTMMSRASSTIEKCFSFVK